MTILYLLGWTIVGVMLLKHHEIILIKEARNEWKRGLRKHWGKSWGRYGWTNVLLIPAFVLWPLTFLLYLLPGVLEKRRELWRESEKGTELLNSANLIGKTVRGKFRSELFGVVSRDGDVALKFRRLDQEIEKNFGLTRESANAILEWLSKEKAEGKF